MTNPFSSEINRIFHEIPSGQVKLSDLLQHHFVIGGQELYNLRSVLASSLGAEDLHFSVNSSHLPNEMKAVNGDIYRFTWSPILTASLTVSAILVTIENISDLKALELKIRNKTDY